MLIRCFTFLFLIFILLDCSGHRRFSRHSTPETRKRPAKVSKPSPEGVYQEGIASYYAHDFNGKQTANGEIFNMHDLTAAHKELPFNTRVWVENLENGKNVTVRINDRGPYAKGRIIDLSLEAAKRIGLIGPGHARVRLVITD